MNELISINSIKNKLNLSLELPEFFINLSEYDVINKIYLQLQLGEEIFKNLILPKKLKAIDIPYHFIKKKIYPSEILTNIFKQCLNLEELSLNCAAFNIDYDSFKYLINL